MSEEQKFNKLYWTNLNHGLDDIRRQIDNNSHTCEQRSLIYKATATYLTASTTVAHATKSNGRMYINTNTIIRIQDKQ